MASLWKVFRYTAPVECVIDNRIRVYDISKANISILHDKGVLASDIYDNLLAAPKLEREIYMGKFLGSNTEAAKILSDGIIEAKKIFFELNSIEDGEVLEIDNDSVCLIGNKPIYHQQISSHVYFRLAEEYTSYYKVKNIKYFYYANMITKQEVLKPKGLGKAEYLHVPYMLDFLKELFFTAQFQGVVKAINLLTTFYGNYCSNSLDIGYYRNLNSESYYSFKRFSGYAVYQSMTVPTPNMRALVDIGYNEKLLREFNRILSGKYFKGIR